MTLEPENRLLDRLEKIIDFPMKAPEVFQEDEADMLEEVSQDVVLPPSRFELIA